MARLRQSWTAMLVVLLGLSCAELALAFLSAAPVVETP